MLHKFICVDGAAKPKTRLLVPALESMSLGDWGPKPFPSVFISRAARFFSITSSPTVLEIAGLAPTNRAAASDEKIASFVGVNLFIFNLC